MFHDNHIERVMKVMNISCWLSIHWWLTHYVHAMTKPDRHFCLNMAVNSGLLIYFFRPYWNFPPIFHIRKENCPHPLVIFFSVFECDSLHKVLFSAKLFKISSNIPKTLNVFGFCYPLEFEFQYIFDKVCVCVCGGGGGGGEGVIGKSSGKSYSFVIHVFNMKCANCTISKNYTLKYLTSPKFSKFALEFASNLLFFQKIVFFLQKFGFSSGENGKSHFLKGIKYQIFQKKNLKGAWQKQFLRN